MVYADIELINGREIILASSYIIGEHEIKRINLNIWVDTGSYMLAINENIQEHLHITLLPILSMHLLSSGHCSAFALYFVRPAGQ